MSETVKKTYEHIKEVIDNLSIQERGELLTMMFFEKEENIDSFKDKKKKKITISGIRQAIEDSLSLKYLNYKGQELGASCALNEYGHYKNKNKTIRTFSFSKTCFFNWKDAFPKFYYYRGKKKVQFFLKSEEIKKIEKHIKDNFEDVIYVGRNRDGRGLVVRVKI